MKNNRQKVQNNGRDYWSFMHTFAAYAPENPSSDEKDKIQFFIKHSADYFLLDPKWKFRFKRNMKKYPPVLDTQLQFSVWMCHQHNMINEMIGKPLFECSEENLIERWGPKKKNHVQI